MKTMTQNYGLRLASEKEPLYESRWNSYLRWRRRILERERIERNERPRIPLRL